jgi:PemK-like, MazF-like toxin of type II toxin-antitoxin system
VSALQPIRTGIGRVRDLVRRRPPRTLDPATEGRASHRTTRTTYVRIRVAYAPVMDGNPDPGEVVWAWVPYEEDPSVGKDRPVLVIGLDGNDLAAVPLTSRGGRPGEFMLGRGAWDGRRKVSWIKTDQLFRVPVADVRREGAALERPRFDQLIAELRRQHNLGG